MIGPEQLAAGERAEALGDYVSATAAYRAVVDVADVHLSSDGIPVIIHDFCTVSALNCGRAVESSTYFRSRAVEAETSVYRLIMRSWTA